MGAKASKASMADRPIANNISELIGAQLKYPTSSFTFEWNEKQFLRTTRF